MPVTGALEVIQKNLENRDPNLLSNRAIGAPELHRPSSISTFDEAREAANNCHDNLRNANAHGLDQDEGLAALRPAAVQNRQ